MENKKLKVYLASGWFTPKTREILDTLESILDSKENIELYSPRRDGVMLPPNQKHDTELRESIFKDNISHITEANLIVANIYSGDSYNDPGTMYEIGYAMAHDIPVLGFTPSIENLDIRFKGIMDGIYLVVGYDLFSAAVDELATPRKEEKRKKKILFVGNGDTSVDDKLVSYMMDSGFSVRWVNDIHNEIYTRIDEIFEDVDFVITVVDDRKTLVSWMIGQAYARNVPVITYSNNNYGINVMLLISILTHIRGTDELVAFLQQVSRYGLESVPKFDISQLDSM